MISLAEMGLPVEQIARGVKESESIVKEWLAESYEDNTDK